MAKQFLGTILDIEVDQSDLQAGQDGRTDAGLEEEDNHEGEGVGGEGVVAGVVDLAVPGPLLHPHHQGPHSPVQLGVAVEEVSVPHTEQQWE